MKRKMNLFVAVMIANLFSVPVLATTVALDGTWYTGAANAGGTPSLSNPDSDSFTWGTDGSATKTAQKGVLWSYFSPQSLANDGESITLSFSVTPLDATATAQSFRFGLFNSGGTQVLHNLVGANSNSGFLNTMGYFSVWNQATSINASLYARTAGSTNPNSSTSGIAVIYTDATGSVTLTQGTTYDMTLMVTRNSATQYSVTSSIGSAVISATTTIINATSFDTVAFMNTPTGIDSFAFSNLQINYSPILGNGDVNGDGYVDAADLILFGAEWLTPNPDPDADFTRDNPATVDMADFQILASNWFYNEYRKTLTGKIMCGYQGWFNCPGDGSNRGWVHWGSGGKFEPGYCTVDWWPDMSQYDADEKFATGFKNADDSTAYVFSSFKEKTVLRHFSWMSDYGIDGVFLQRFATETTPGSTARAHKDQVMLHCRKGANKYKRAWAMMYDLSSDLTGLELKDKVINDWKYLVDTFGVSKVSTDGAYLHHKGKPVVAIWGLGFGRVYEGQDTYNLVNFLKNDPVYGGCTIMIGVDNSWRTNSDTWFQQIVGLADIISPWAVGRYGSKSTIDLNIFTYYYTVPDQVWCNANGKDYLPVVFPGFSWQNLMQNNNFDQTPRLGGQFLWRQFYKAIHDAGATMIYQAMFDEVDEGTAIFKCTSTPPIAETPTSVFSNPFLPTGNAQHLPYRPSDALLPSDHYLWLVGQGTRMLRGEIPLTETMPVR